MSPPVVADPLPAYRVNRSKRKTLALHVRDQCVEVRSPWQVGDAEIKAFVAQHQGWIARMLQAQARRSRQRMQLVEGGRVFYKGREHLLRLQQQSQPAVKLVERSMVLCGPALSPAQCSLILRTWLMDEARRWLVPRTHALVAHMGLTSCFHEVVLRKTRSKWGHCTAKGRIQYNWLIMLAPDAVIDYMICHEVCHLRHMNHSVEFWALVASLCPQHRQCRQWLREHGHRLWFD